MTKTKLQRMSKADIENAVAHISKARYELANIGGVFGLYIQSEFLGLDSKYENLVAELDRRLAAKAVKANKPNEEFMIRVETFVEGCQIILNKYMEQYENLVPDVLIYKVNQRYTKVITTNGIDGKERSVYCFVDNTNGDVLKSAGWSAPAKHARGNIFDDNNGLRSMGPHGAAYLRG